MPELHCDAACCKQSLSLWQKLFSSSILLYLRQQGTKKSKTPRKVNIGQVWDWLMVWHGCAKSGVTAVVVTIPGTPEEPICNLFTYDEAHNDSKHA